MIGQPTEYQTKKETERFLEDLRTELRIEGLKLQIQATEITTKTVVVTGEYSDYLISKKIITSKGWNVEYHAQN